MTTIVMYRGDDKTFPFTLTQNALPIDLTTAAIVFSGRAAADFDDDEPAAFSLVSPTDITILPDQTTTGKGKVTVTIPATTSVDLEGKYLCDIQVTLGGDVWTWPEPEYGQSTLIRLKVKADVTHPVNAMILGYDRDTNGQNARFVRAAEKWGTDESILRILAIGNDDPAGVVGRYRIASDKLGGLKIRSAARTPHYFDWPGDIIWSRTTEGYIRKLANEADLIHLNNSYRAAQRFGIRKPMLLHHHGSLFRNNPEHMLGVAKHHRMTQAVSTIDLQRPDPKVLHWLPTAYDIDALTTFGQQNRREPDGRVRIVHAPTNRMLKHTDLFMAIVEKLQGEGLPIDLDLVERQSWSETMTRKAKADIVYDQLALGYGCNSVEAWAMSIPVIAGADDWTLARMTQEWAGLPFVPANEKTLEQTLRNMVTSADMRQEASEIGHAHVRKYHDERPALAKLAELYAKAIKGYTSLRIPGKGQKAVTFEKKNQAKVYDIDGSLITFEGGKLKTADPIVIDRLRKVAKRSIFGVVEVP